jgi:DNA-binding XRE family transcriptional regulator
MLNFLAMTANEWSPIERLKVYRGFLDLTQAGLAAQMGTTQTSVARWESEIAPISLATMSHVRRLVEIKIMSEAQHLLFLLWQGLKGCSDGSVGGTPHTEFTKDNKGNLYLGAYFIDGYRKHSLHLRIDDRQWYGLDRDGRPVRVDERFIRSIALALKS